MIPHGFSWYNLLCLGLVVAFVWAICYGRIIVPQIRSTANQIASLNTLPNVNCTIKVKGCMLFSPTITVICQRTP